MQFVFHCLIHMMMQMSCMSNSTCAYNWSNKYKLLRYTLFNKWPQNTVFVPKIFLTNKVIFFLLNQNIKYSIKKENY